MSYYLKKNLKKLLPVWLILALSSVVYTLWQLGLMHAVDAAARLELEEFLRWTAVVIAGITLYFAMYALENYWEARAIRDMNNQLRHDLYLSLIERSHDEYHGQDTGEYLSWLTTNIKQIERLAWGPVFGCVTSVTAVICNIAAMVSLHWIILVAGLISAGVMLVFPGLFQKHMARLGEECAASEAEGGSKLKDLLSGFDVLRSFGRIDRFLKQGNTVSSQIENPNCRRTCFQAYSALAVGLMGNLLTIVQMAVAVILALQGKVIFGAMVGATNLTGGIVGNLQNLTSQRMSLVSAKPYFQNITVHKGEVPSGKVERMEPVKDAITVENLRFRYGEQPVLQDLSMRFQKGGKYAVTGPSGCGKSTLLKLLLGWLPGYDGSIRFDEKDARDFTPDQLQQQMSYIEQNVFLFNSSIRDNITLGETFTDTEMQAALRDSALAVDLASMPDGLDTEVGELGSNLSGGQKQRVAIARALIHNRSILLVDEGTSALDQENADIVEKSLLARPEVTLILVSHHLTPERKQQFTQVYDLRAATQKEASTTLH